MTKPNMKPFDPEHKGEFCTRDGHPVEILKRDRRSAGGNYPIVGLMTHENVEHQAAWASDGRANHLTRAPSFGDLMCVIPKREALIVKFDEDGCLLFGTTKKARSNTTFREVMPDDISQEKAQAVIDAARAVLGIQHHHELGDALTTLRAALGDDA